ncbi:hypothetical protein BDZ97DRAFT_1918208 [Flammula alnicola]|nr:hypothetical protein BDZ97DRAFT_1918208 [Flammula alnicola]
MFSNIRDIAHTAQRIHYLTRDLYKVLDDELKHELAHAWSLPHNPRFMKKLQMIQDLAESIHATPDLLKSRIAYIIQRIHEIIMERIELSRLETNPGAQSFNNEVDLDLPNDLELSSLVD